MKANHSCYLRSIFSSPKVLKETIRLAKKDLKNIPEFDAIAVTGVSGTTIGSILSYALNKRLIVIRKESEISHGDYSAEGHLREKFNFIIVDDFIATGNTVVNILEKIDLKLGNFCGVYCYNALDYKFFTLEKAIKRINHYKGIKERFDKLEIGLTV